MDSGIHHRGHERPGYLPYQSQDPHPRLDPVRNSVGDRRWRNSVLRRHLRPRPQALGAARLSTPLERSEIGDQTVYLLLRLAVLGFIITLIAIELIAPQGHWPRAVRGDLPLAIDDAVDLFGRKFTPVP